MKNKKYISFILITLVVTIFSCSKARIEKPIDDIVKTPPTDEDNTDLIKFIPLDDYFSTKIKSPEKIECMTHPFTNTITYPYSSDGTSIGLNKDMLIQQNGDSVQYPFELYLYKYTTIKEFIYLETKGTLNDSLQNIISIHNIIAINNGNIALLRPNIKYIFSSTNNKTINSFETVYNYKTNNISDNWLKTNNIVNHNNNNLNLWFDYIGWSLFSINIYRNNTYTKLQFTSSKYDLTNVGIYVVFSDKNSFTRIQNLESIDLPVGEQAKLVAFGITNQGQLYSYFNDITIEEQVEYELFLTPISDANLTNLLDQL